MKQEDGLIPILTSTGQRCGWWPVAVWRYLFPPNFPLSGPGLRSGGDTLMNIQIPGKSKLTSTSAARIVSHDTHVGCMASEDCRLQISILAWTALLRRHHIRHQKKLHIYNMEHFARRPNSTLNNKLDIMSREKIMSRPRFSECFSWDSSQSETARPDQHYLISRKG